jgi:hypothetical protein
LDSVIQEINRKPIKDAKRATTNLASVCLILRLWSGGSHFVAADESKGPLTTLPTMCQLDTL